jgi:RNA polymerase sigma factor (sigma-70 family)
MQGPDPESDLERLHADSFGWALACCGWDRTEAEEVIQTTYLKVLEGTARYEGRAAFKTWLFAVIRRTAAERRRRHRFQGLAVWRWLDERPRAAADSAETEASRTQASAELVEALAALPGRQRQVLHLVFYQDLTIREAAEVLGVSLGTARRHYERGKQRLREILGAPLRAVECFE